MIIYLFSTTDTYDDTLVQSFFLALFIVGSCNCYILIDCLRLLNSELIVILLYHFLQFGQSHVPQGMAEIGACPNVPLAGCRQTVRKNGCKLSRNSF